jgi:hypothetical protein
MVAMGPSAGPAAGKPIKAYLFDDDHNVRVVDCLFNPTEYSFSKTNSWQRESKDKANVPVLQFKGGSDMTLTLSLLFDTYMTREQEDVRKHTDKVLKLMEIDPTLKDATTETGRPPRVSFHWGNYWSFKAVVTAVKQRFSLFLSDGRPVRATLEVSFLQVQDPKERPKTNPTSVAESRKLRVVMPGETIDSIAFAEYRDPDRWRLIADHNELDDPLRLRPGQKLAIPLV